MRPIRLTAFLQITWGSSFIAFNVACLAFWSLWIPESLWIAFGAIQQPPTSMSDLPAALFDATLLVLIHGCLYALAFQLLFVAVRAFAALLSRGHRLLTGVTPGLASFVIVVEPLLAYATAANGMFWGLSPLALLASIGPGLLLIAVSPIFRGYNASFLLASALAARVILFPVPVPEDITALLIYEFTLLLSCFFVFITLQLRYRLQLWPNYENFEIPDRFVRVGAVLAVVCAALFLLTEWSHGFFIPTAAWLVCAVQWTVTAWLLERGRIVSLEQQSRRAEKASVQTLAIISGGLVAALLALLVFPQSHLERVQSARSVSAELLDLSGIVLDGDQDGNSRWPGGDPNDRNDCIRADFRHRCADARPTSAEPEAQAVVYNPRVPRRPLPAAENSILITWVSDSIRMPSEFEATPVVLPANQAAPALSAIFHNADGVGQRPDSPEADGLISRLAQRGVRTVCAGRTAGAQYFRSDSPAGLDRGCQVFQSLAAESEANINRTVLEALFVFDRYREATPNFLWIHYDDGPQLEGQARATVPALERETLLRLRSTGDVPLLPLQPDRLRGTMYLMGARQLRETPELPRPGELLAFSMGLRNTPPGSSVGQTLALIPTETERSWWRRSLERLGALPKRFPVRTLRVTEDGMLERFDGYTGVRSRP